MAELTNDCCAPSAQATCCEPADKAACCGESHAPGCGCAAGGDEFVRARRGAAATPEQMRVHEHAAAAMIGARKPVAT